MVVVVFVSVCVYVRARACVRTQDQNQADHLARKIHGDGGVGYDKHLPRGPPEKKLHEPAGERKLSES